MGDEQRDQAQEPAGEASVPKWGDSLGRLDEGRKAELAGRLWEWKTEQATADWPGPFAGERLTGLEVSWLAACAAAGRDGDTAAAAQRLSDDLQRITVSVRGLHLEGAVLVKAHLERAYLREAHLEGADLSEAGLRGAFLGGASLEHANLTAAHLEGAALGGAHLNEASLGAAHCEGVDFSWADLGKASLTGAYLAGTYFHAAHLEGAYLEGAQMQGKVLESDEVAVIQRWKPDFPATLRPANLWQAIFDSAAVLDSAVVGDDKLGGIFVGDVRWGGANLTVIDWAPVTETGEERTARTLKPGDEPDPAVFERGRLQIYGRAVRANRQLAAVLRDQGLNEVADRFAYRAQVLNRDLMWLQAQGQEVPLRARIGKYAGWFGSTFLDGLAGYGYKPSRSLFAYAFTILSYMGFYLLNSHVATPHLTWDEALVLSMSSFHGRGFFNPNIMLSDTYARLAASEAFFGLVIEVSLIATFTQRFFAR